MKFTKFALASAAAFGLAGAALADGDPLVADGLDTWFDLTVAPTNGCNVNGGVGTTNAVWFGGSSADDTKVMAYPSGVGDLPTKPAENSRPTAMLGFTNSNYLKVSNSDPLWRMIKAYGQVDDAWPTSFPNQQDTNVSVGNGLYVDTLVQFTPSEDAPTVDPQEDGSKLVVWMDSNSNLCVTAGYIVYDGSPVTVPTNFVTSTKLEVNQWYRLTVSAYGDVDSSADTEFTLNGFTVRINGQLVTSTTAVAADSFLESEFAEYLTAPADSLIGTKQFFGSLIYDQAATLAAVGFKGEGLVDDIVVTDVLPTFPDPTPGGGIDFTLSWSEGVSAVWYAIDGGEKQAATSGVAITDVSANATVVITADAEAWYTIDASSIPSTVADGQTYTITASEAATGGEAGMTGDLAGFSASDLKSAFPNSSPSDIDDAENAYLKYQLGQALDSSLTANPQVTITDITQVEGGWAIKVQVTDSGSALAINDGTNSKMKATLKVKSAATLADFADSTKVTTASYAVTFDGTTTDVITVPTTGENANTDPFFKAYIEYAQPASQSNEL